MANEKNTTTLLRNIHYMLGHVYHQAYSEIQWTESDSQQALSWASYCQKVS